MPGWFNLTSEMFGYLALIAFLVPATWCIHRVYHADWTKFEPRYAAEKLPDPIASEKAAAVRIALVGKAGFYPTTKTKWHSFVSVTIGLYRDGISLSIMPMLRFGSRDLFLPFDEMRVGTVKWLGWTDHYGIAMSGVDELEVVIPRSTLKKLSAYSTTLGRIVQTARPSQATQNEFTSDKKSV